MNRIRRPRPQVLHRLQDAQALREHLGLIDRDIKSDPPGAIDSSKELLEAVRETILADYDAEARDGADMMEL